MNDFGSWLIMQLAKAKITRTDLAKAVGVSKGCVSNWIIESRIPPLDKLLKVLDVIGFELVIRKKEKGHE